MNKNWTGQKRLKKWSGDEASGPAGPSARAEIQAILNLNPLHYWEMRYTTDPKYGQLLYQDPGAITPVTLATQPIGWIKNLGSADPTRSAYSMNTNSLANANRPIYGGSTVGADFRINGGSQKGIGIDNMPNLSYPISVFQNLLELGANSAETGEDDIVFLIGNPGPNQAIAMFIPVQPLIADEVWSQIQFDLVGSEIQSCDSSLVLGGYRSLINTFDFNANQCLFYIDNVFQNGADSLAANPVFTVAAVGFLGSSNQMSGYQKSIVIWDRILTSGERATLQGLI